MPLTTGKIPVAADGTHIIDGYDAVTSVGSPGVDTAISTEKGVRTALNAKEDTFSKNSAFNKNFGVTSNTVCEGNDARLSDARTPSAHNITHTAAGGDPVKLDDLQAPDDNTDLDVSISAHGLTPKLSNVATEFLNGIGTYTVPIAALTNNIQILYVGKHGNDANSGKTIEAPFLTIGAAITAANALVPSSSNPITVQVVDAGVYTESITLIAYVQLYAPTATINGNHILNDSSEFVARNCSISSGDLFTKSSGTGICTVVVNSIVLSNTANGFECSAGTINYLGNALIHTGTGIGIGTPATTSHIHAKLNEIFLTSTGTAIYVDDSGHISISAEEINAPSGTCMEIDGTGEIFITASNIVGTVAYDVDTGTLYIISSNVSGTRITSGGGTVKYGGGQTKTLVVENAGNDTLGDHRVRNVGSNSGFNLSFEVPFDFISLISIKVIGVTLASIAAQSVDLTSDYGAVGEQYNNHSESDLTYTITTTGGEITEFDISSVFTGLTVGDAAGMRWKNNLIGTTFYFMRMELTYQT